MWTYVDETIIIGKARPFFSPSGFLASHICTAFYLWNPDFPNRYQARPFFLCTCLLGSSVFSWVSNPRWRCCASLCPALSSQPHPPYRHYPCLVSLMKTTSAYSSSRPKSAQDFHARPFMPSVHGPECLVPTDRAVRRDKAGTWISHLPRAAPCKTLSLFQQRYWHSGRGILWPSFIPSANHVSWIHSTNIYDACYVPGTVLYNRTWALPYAKEKGKI